MRVIATYMLAALTGVGLAVTATTSHAGRWVVLDDFNSGFGPKTSVENNGGAGTITAEGGFAVIAPSDEDRGVILSLNKGAMSRATHYEVTFKTRGCDDAESYSFDVIAAMSGPRVELPNRAAVVSFERFAGINEDGRGDQVLTIEEERGPFTPFGTDPSMKMEIKLRDGLTRKFVLAFNHKQAVLTGNSASELKIKPRLEGEPLARINRYLHLGGEVTDATNDCAFLVDRVRAYIP